MSKANELFLKDNWKTYQLSQICSLRSGKTPSTKKKEYWCSHEEECDCINWYTGKDITRENLETERKITQLAAQKCKMPLTTESSLLFFHIECLPFRSAQTNTTCNQIISLLEPDLKIVIPNFLYYSLLASKNRLRSIRTGSVQMFTKQTHLASFSLTLPPLPQQQKILSYFQLVYNKIHKTEVQYKDTLIKIIQKHLELGDLLFLKYKDSEIRIEDEFKLVRGKTPPTKIKEYWENGTIKWLNNGALTNCYFLTEHTKPSKLISTRALSECQLQYCQKNSIVISLVETTAKKMVWNQTENLVVGCNVCNLTSNSKSQNATLFFALRKFDFLLLRAEAWLIIYAVLT